MRLYFLGKLAEVTDPENLAKQEAWAGLRYYAKVTNHLEDSVVPPTGLFGPY